jgi:hypothetical protein
LRGDLEDATFIDLPFIIIHKYSAGSLLEKSGDEAILVIKIIRLGSQFLPAASLEI